MHSTVLPARPALRQAQRLFTLCLLGAALLVVDLNVAVAGTGGAEFSPLYTTLTGWMTGYLGRVISAVFIIVGLVAGVTRGSVMGFVLGVAAGVGLFLAPDIINATVSATLPVGV